MSDPGSNDFLDIDCDRDLYSGWEKVEVQQAKEAAKAARAAGQDEDADMTAYIVKQVQEMRPRSAADYREPRCSLPHPCMQPVDSPLIGNSAAWAVAGMHLIYIVWHFIPQLVGMAAAGHARWQTTMPSLLQAHSSGRCREAADSGRVLQAAVSR